VSHHSKLGYRKFKADLLRRDVCFTFAPNLVAQDLGSDVRETNLSACKCLRLNCTKAGSAAYVVNRIEAFLTSIATVVN